MDRIYCFGSLLMGRILIFYYLLISAMYHGAGVHIVTALRTVQVLLLLCGIQLNLRRQLLS